MVVASNFLILPAMDPVFVLSKNPYVEILTPKVMVLVVEAFGGDEAENPHEYD